ncbi:hypothetical protein BCV63_03695 [Cylindrospermopsis raciborskii CS-508]|nr:hypothetical protein BCV63_03695 [Cylindrospermopsis raciborskii CS-508]
MGSTIIIVGTVSLIGLIPHWKNRNINFRKAFIFGSATMLGAFLGAKIAGLPFITDNLQMLLFAIVMLIAAFLMIRRSRQNPDKSSVKYQKDLQARKDRSFDLDRGYPPQDQDICQDDVYEHIYQLLAASLGSFFGGYLSGFIDGRKLQKYFGYFLIAVAAFVLFQNQTAATGKKTATGLIKSASISPYYKEALTKL